MTCKATIPDEMEVEAHFLAKEDGIVAGIALAEMIFDEVDSSLKVIKHVFISRVILELCFFLIVYTKKVKGKFNGQFVHFTRSNGIEKMATAYTKACSLARYMVSEIL